MRKTLVFLAMVFPLFASPKISQKEIECMKELRNRLIATKIISPVHYEIEKTYLQLLYQRGYSFCEVYEILKSFEREGGKNE